MLKRGWDKLRPGFPVSEGLRPALVFLLAAVVLAQGQHSVLTSRASEQSATACTMIRPRFNRL